jgi:endonuclease YncB( thermonuclease family)
MSLHIFLPGSLLIMLTCLVLATGTAAAREVSSSAHVNEDGTLQLNGQTVHLYGIHIPKTGNTCRTSQIPPTCGSRASIALDFKINGFVNCQIMQENNDRSVVGWCRIKVSHFDEGEDLSAYLLEKGWAVALPDAPFEYQTLEKISRGRGFGVWGMPVDSAVGSN